MEKYEKDEDITMQAIDDLANLPKWGIILWVITLLLLCIGGLRLIYGVLGAQF